MRNINRFSRVTALTMIYNKSLDSHCFPFFFFCWKPSGSIQTPFLQHIRKVGDLYGLWIAQGYQDLFTRGARSLSQPGLSVLQSPEVSGIISKEWREHVEGIYLWRGEGRGRVRGKLQGAISAEKWEWKGWKPINENQYEKAGRHKNWGEGNRID